MIPWKLLDSTIVPGDGTELCLYSRGDEFSIRINGCELMNSRVHGSEDALAEFACERIRNQTSRVLVGGLGMGYTTAATLNLLNAESLVIVAELLPSVTEWNRKFLGKLAGDPLNDPRVTVREVDVAIVIKNDNLPYNAILLDVDNGPEALTRKANSWLYTEAGIRAAFAALLPGGVLGIWSAGPDMDFLKRLRRAGFDVEEFNVRARKSAGGDRHTIWIAVRI
jgi:spermidine synthase